MTHYTEHLGPVADAVEEALRSLSWQEAARRLWARDHTLWGDDPAEITNRLGWLTEPDAMGEALPFLAAFAADARGEGVERAVWCGMGGSSLFAEVLARDPDRVFPLEVLDTSHPAAVERAARPGSDTLWCFASKSGGTIETRCHLDHFWARDSRPDRFAVVTDAGSALDDLARTRAFRRVFHANPDIGGRYSALSHFGLVPAALLGADLEALLAGAQVMAARCAPGEQPAANPGLRLAAVLAGAAAAGRDKLTLVVPDGLEGFATWVEQLVAESTGKTGRGILPVVDEPLGPPDVYGDDRLFVAYDSDPALDMLAAAGQPVVVLGGAGRDDLGREVFRWEVAVALASVMLCVNPFDQPDVESAKQATAAALAGESPPVAVADPAQLVAAIGPRDYVALQAFCDPADPALEALERLRVSLRDRHRVAVTVGIGPRYLHSTGQLHKGGPPSGVFLQVLDPALDAAGEAPIPGHPYGFAALLRAQADGDLRALQAQGRRAARVDLDALLALGA